MVGSITKSRTETREVNDNRTGPNTEGRPQAFNPEGSENRGRDKHEAPSMNRNIPGSDSRSKSMTPGEPNAIRPKQPLPNKESKPSVTGETVTMGNPNDRGNLTVNTSEPPGFMTPQQAKEDDNLPPQQLRPPTPTLAGSDKVGTPNPFNRIPNSAINNAKEEEGADHTGNRTSDKAHNTNPFGAVNQGSNNQGSTHNSSANALNINAKTMPFGGGPMKGRPMPGGRLPGAGMPNTNHSGGELGVNVNGVNTGLKPNLSQSNTPTIPPTDQLGRDKSEERIPAPVQNQEEENKQQTSILGGEEGATIGTEGESEPAPEVSGGNKPFIPPMGGRPTIGMNAGLRPKVPGVGAGNKGLPVPGIKKPGLPAANVFKGPPGNIPRTMPGQVKVMSGQVPPDGGAGNNSQV